MGVSFPFVREVDVDTFVPDDDPNLTDPDADPANPKSFNLPARIPNGELGVSRTVTFFTEFDPATADTISLAFWLKDEDTGHWAFVLGGGVGAVPNNALRVLNHNAPGPRIFVQVTALGAGAPAGGKGYLRLAAS
jgi:hypothetical protein